MKLTRTKRSWQMVGKTALDAVDSRLQLGQMHAVVLAFHVPQHTVDVALDVFNAAIETIEEDGLLDRAHSIGERFRGHFERFRGEMPGLIADIRILGAMIGLELTTDASVVVAKALEKRLLVNATHGTVLRLLPALNISDDQIDEGCAILGEALQGLAGAGA